MYLFIFTLLLVLFMFMNSKKIIENNMKVIEDYKTEVNNYKTSDSISKDKIFEYSQFSVDRNDAAITYFDNQGYDSDVVFKMVKDELFALNDYKGEEHPIIPYGSSEGRKMLINNVRLVNHKWVLAEFSDGQFSGELFITYFINDKQELKFNVEEHLLYPLN
ncbi:hydrolase [Lacinutrix salivirga]